MLAAHGLKAEHPDAFLLGLYQESPDRFLEALERVRARLQPPVSPEQHVAALRAPPPRNANPEAKAAVEAATRGSTAASAI